MGSGGALLVGLPDIQEGSGEEGGGGGGGGGANDGGGGVGGGEVLSGAGGSGPIYRVKTGTISRMACHAVAALTLRF